MRTLTIGKNDAGQRADKFLSKALVNLPASLLHKYFRKKCVKINGVHSKGTEILKAGDVLSLYISDEFFPDTQKQTSIELSSHTLNEDDIAYEDENIIILDKSQGELVHSSLPDEESSGNEICLVDRLIGYLIKKGEYNPQTENSFTPALCASMQASLCVKLLAGRPVETGTVYYFDLLNQEFETIPLV